MKTRNVLLKVDHKARHKLVLAHSLLSSQWFTSISISDNNYNNAGIGIMCSQILRQNLDNLCVTDVITK